MDNGKTKYMVTLTGVTPLLMHRDDIDYEFEQYESGRERKGGKAGDDRVPAGMWKRRIHADNDGKFVAVPTEAIMAALKNAGRKLTKKGKETFKAATQSDIIIEDDHIPIIVGKKTIPVAKLNAIKGRFSEHCAAVKKLGFALFVKRTVVGNRRHVRVRPRFDKWKLVIPVTCFHEDMNHTQFKNIWELAGRKAGLLNWRPSAKEPGNFGMFTASIKKVRNGK